MLLLFLNFICLVYCVEKDYLGEYDYIVVGAGASGSVVANRLSKNPHVKVLLLEAGEEPNLISQIPGYIERLQQGKYDWNFRTKPQKHSCLGEVNRRCRFPQGLALGGSSTINYMTYTRGNKYDYDSWAGSGAVGWDWESVLPYFKKSEDNRDPFILKNGLHGIGGELTVETPDYINPLGEAYLEAFKELGYRLGDHNGPSAAVFSVPQKTTRNNLRRSTYNSFIKPALSRKNLCVIASAYVTQILIDQDNRANAVEFYFGNKTRVISAKREVIISAGAIKSPQLLMLSGVGPKEILHRFNIPVIADLPVGKNFHDHSGSSGLTFLIDKPYTEMDGRTTKEEILEFLEEGKGRLTLPLGMEVIGYVNSKFNKIPEWPDIEIIFGSKILGPGGNNERSHEGYGGIWKRSDVPYVSNDTIICLAGTQQPLSRGEITLRSTNPFEDPIIDPNFFAVPYDVKIVVEGMKICLALADTDAMRKLGARPNERRYPECEEYPRFSEPYLDCLARMATYAFFHFSGSCKMGDVSDPTTVVDPRLRVIGVHGLRVVDASIIPAAPTAHTYAAAVMIGEKGADMIIQDNLII